MNTPHRTPWISTLALGLVSIGGALGLRHADASTPSASASSAVAPASATDDGIGDALVALANCDGKSLREACAASDVWNKRIEAARATDEDTPTGKAEHSRYASACLPNLAHVSPGVRDAAASCVAAFASHLADRKVAANAVLAQFSVETFDSARGSQLSAIRRLNPTEHGLAGQVVALARPLMGSQAGQSTLGELVSALEPPLAEPEVAPAPEAITFALELVKRREAVSSAIGVLSQVTSPGPEVCAGLLDLTQTKRGAWPLAVKALSGEGEHCTAQREATMQLIIEIAKRPAGPTEAHGLADNAYPIKDFVEVAKPSPVQKKILSEALKGVSASKANSESFEALRKALLAK